ncbi:phosphoglycerol transferase I [Pseudoxanthomonas putridarboris]|uniref:Phosphoglycerol transferase I n=1 Tax=Pseudoxanthomonas putridarboris TaxID=752605 RepID=A0ABU9J416_9GAMM
MSLLLFLCVLALVWLLLASTTRRRTKAALLSLLLVSLAVWWLIDRLSGDGINAATLYHLDTGLQGAGIAEFRGLIMAFVGLVAIALSSLLLVRIRRFRLPRHGTTVSLSFSAVFVVAVLASPIFSDALRLYHMSRPADVSTVAAEYLLPDKPVMQPRNIVWIYGESLERTYLDDSVFPGLMPNLARLAGEAVDFRDIVSPEGSGWTIAGLVSSMCGIPLTTSRGDENSMGRMNHFLPGAYCLGDYLKQQGYTLRFSGGADAAFAAKGDFLASHGFDQVKDRRHFENAGVPKRHFSNWGIHDDVLLDDVFDDFMSLSADGQPFMLTTLTMDTHHPAGHLPVSCRDTRYDSALGDIGLLRALKCTDRLISELVDKIRRSPYADNTLIVVASDHLAMPNDLSDVLARQHRENLLLLLAPDLPPRQVASGGSTLDSGATVLQLLNPALHALGFGRSLLASAPPSASVAARSGDQARYQSYLGFARQLWTGQETGILRMDDDRVIVGQQQIKPPVLLEYDSQWNITSIVLEDAPRQFMRDPDNVLAYIDRCTAFEDALPLGEWCALLVDRSNDLKLYTDLDLQQGVKIDAPLETHGEPRPRPRRPLTLSHESRRMLAGQYQLRLRPQRLPSHPFWLEAVSADGKVVHAREWVRVEGHEGGQIRLPVWLDTTVDDLVIRAWLDYTEDMPLEGIALTRVPPRKRS